MPDTHQLPDAEKLRVLLVDDDKKLLVAFKLYLSKKMDVTVAYSGPEALELLQDQTFSVIVSDMQMPAMDGIEFIMRAREIAPDCSYMLFTSSRESKVAANAFNEANVFCMISKPCGLADLAGFIEAAHVQYLKQKQ